MPKTGRSGWGRTGHRRAVLVGALVALLVVGGGVAAWGAVNGGNAGYRTSTVTRADIGTTLTVVGNVEPVSDASAGFGVGGQVTSVNVSPGQQVSAGQTLATLDTTAMSQSVSSDQSTLAADQAKLAEDETSQSSTASPSSSGSSASSPKGSSGAGSSSPTNSNPGHGGATGSGGSGAQAGTGGTGGAGGTAGTGGTGGSGAQGGGSNPVITQDQNTLTQDEATLSKDQQKEAADLAQAQSDCASANTATPAGQTTCEAALETVSADEQVVSNDQSTVSKDENALGQALAGASSGTGTGNSGAALTGYSSSSSSAHAADLTADVTGNTGTGSAGTGGSSNTGGGSGNQGGGSPSGGSSANADTPQQIASDQAAIDTATANLTEAQQSLNAATLTSPINGTVVSVGINAGDTVSANSSTENITVVGTTSYEAQATLDSSQVPSVKAGQSAAVEVDGVNGTLQGRVAQVGPVQSTSSGYTYPVVVTLPATSDGLYAGSGANVTISTGEVSQVVAVPTSAVQTLGTRSYVLELVNGELTRKVIKVGMVGDVYTQVLSGLSPGQSVVLADYGEAVPSSNTNTVGGVGGLLGGRGGGGFLGGGAFPGGGGGGFFQRAGGGGGGGNATIGG